MLVPMAVIFSVVMSCSCSRVSHTHTCHRSQWVNISLQHFVLNTTHAAMAFLSMTTRAFSQRSFISFCVRSFCDCDCHTRINCTRSLTAIAARIPFFCSAIIPMASRVEEAAATSFPCQNKRYSHRLEIECDFIFCSWFSFSQLISYTLAHREYSRVNSYSLNTNGPWRTREPREVIRKLNFRPPPVHIFRARSGQKWILQTPQKKHISSEIVRFIELSV